MSLRKPAFLASTIALALSVFCAAGNPSDPIVGAWNAHVVEMMTVTQGGVTSSSSNDFDTTLVYGASGQADWAFALTGSWTKKQGHYGADFGDSMLAVYASQNPTAQLSGKFKVSNVHVILPAQSAKLASKLKVDIQGVKAKNSQLGSYAATLQ